MLRYFPEDADPKTKGILSRYADLRYKAMAARQHGAKAMHRRHRSALAERRRTGADDASTRRSPGPASSRSASAATVADAMFEATPDKTLAAAQKALDDANPHAPASRSRT